MKVDTMRKIDHYVGVPLCFLFGWLLNLFARLFGTRTDKPRKVLLIELSEMGSAILVDPAMRKMQQQGAELFFVIFAKNAASLYLLDTVPRKNIFTIRDTALVPLAIDSLRMIFWARRMKIDTTLDLELFSRYSGLLTGLSGAGRKVGFHAFHNEGLYRGNMLTHKVGYNAHMHIAKNFLAMVHAAYSETPELPFSKIIIPDTELKLAKSEIDSEQLFTMRQKIRNCYGAYQEAGHRIVLINPNASDLLPQRRWMPERYVEVMQSILSNYEDVLVLITGAPGEREEAEGMRKRVGHERCINFAGQLKLTELPALYTLSTLMLSNDSGPGHFSSVTDMPTFVIFGPETPQLYGSLGNSQAIYAGLACSPCVSAANHRKTPCHDNVCLQVIQVEDVLQELTPILDNQVMIR